MADFREDEIAEARSKNHGKEEPGVVGHGDQHEDVGHTHLDHVEE